MAGSGIGRLSLTRRRVWVAAVTAVVAGGLALINSTTPVSATPVSVATEAEYRQALIDLTADASGPHVIEITADITIAGNTDPAYTGAQALTINGNGFTLDGGDNSRVLSGGFGDLTINDATITRGRATVGGGGGVDVRGILTVTGSTITSNTATAGSGGGLSGSSNVSVTNSTLRGNSASAFGGAVHSENMLGITNSTITGNTATLSGGGVSGLFVTLVYATVVDNTAPSGANVRGTLSAPPALTSFGSVVALPNGGGANCAASGGSVSLGYNYSDDASCAFTGTGDTQNGADPQLQLLGSFGGPTQTRPPAAISPLVDAIPVAACDPTVTSDQRGLPRPADGNDDGTNGCDIGAVELQATPPPAPPAPPAPTAGPVAARPTFTG